MEIAYGHFLELISPAGSTAYRWQNFFIKESVDGYSFVPFNFSGITINRQGDNVDATLLFPNNEISRQWALTAVTESWLAKVQINIFDPDNRSQRTMLHSYVGQISSGAWDDTTINIRLNTVIDAVGGEVPTRRLTKNLVGNLPTSSNVRLQ